MAVRQWRGSTERMWYRVVGGGDRVQASLILEQNVKLSVLVRKIKLFNPVQVLTCLSCHLSHYVYRMLREPVTLIQYTTV